MCSQKYWALIHAYSIDGVAVPGDVDVWRYKQRKINILNRVVKFEKKKTEKKDRRSQSLQFTSMCK